MLFGSKTTIQTRRMLKKGNFYKTEKHVNLSFSFTQLSNQLSDINNVSNYWIIQFGLLRNENTTQQWL